MDFVDAQVVHRLLPFTQLVDALQTAHQGPEPIIEHTLIADQEDRYGESFLCLPAWLPGEAFGVKMITVVPKNGSRRLPSVNAVYQLFDGDTGVPTLTIEGQSLTYHKTAADSALGARYLARSDARRMLMIGAGELASYLIRGHIETMPGLSEVWIWNRTPERAESLALELKSDGISATAVPDLEAAVRGADLISCATFSVDPLIKGEWLSPGTHVDLVGGYTPRMREADDAAVSRASLFVDSRVSTMERVGDIAIPLQSGIIKEDDVLADLYQLCRMEHPGRRSDDEITLYKNGGGAHLDLFTAQLLNNQLALEQA